MTTLVAGTWMGILNRPNFERALNQQFLVLYEKYGIDMKAVYNDINASCHIVLTGDPTRLADYHASNDGKIHQDHLDAINKCCSGGFITD